MEATVKMAAEPKKYKGVARQSESVFCAKEPRNTKYVFGVLLDYVFETLSHIRAEQNRPVTFVQAGANDGVRGDPLQAHVSKHGWKGALIEPVPAAFARLKETYKNAQGLHFVPCAIWHEEGEKDFHWVEGEDVISSFCMDTIMLHDLKYEDLPSMLHTITVPTKTLETVCAECDVMEPDILAIDVEGCDDQVLYTFDLTRFLPPIIFFEHVALPRERSVALKQKLESHGYTLIYDRHDCLCVQEGVFPDYFTPFLKKLMKTAREN